MKFIKIFEEYSNKTPYIYDDPKLVEMITKTIEKDGSSFICTYVASAIKMLEGDNIKIYGFSTCENPESKYFLEENGEDSDEGHHFAVMNERYIIDPWIYDNYEDYSTKKIFGRSVFDLQNEKDEEIIRYLYGDKNNWTNITKQIERNEKFEKMFPNSYKDLVHFYNSIRINI